MSDAMRCPCYGTARGVMLTTRAAALAMAVVAPCSALAQELAVEFDVSLRGVRAGTLEMRGTEAGGRYEVQGAARSTGLIGEIANWSVSAAVAGSKAGGNGYRPTEFAFLRNDRKGETSGRYRYVGGVPRIEQTPPDDGREPWHARPEDQRGTVDPLTAAWALLRDHPRSDACDLDLAAFNGRTRSRLRLVRMSNEEDRLICDGIYSRVDGYSAEEMADQVSWPFRLVYQEVGGSTVRVSELRLPTKYGVVRVRRK